jgi:hypothetical protein
MNSEACIVASEFLHRLVSLAAPRGKSRGFSYEPEMTERLKETYPPETVEAVHGVIRMINLSNLFGNTVDRVLHALSFGLLGGTKK